MVDLGSGTGLLTLQAAPLTSRVWSVDVSSAMSDYLATKALSAGLTNVETVTSSIVSLPLVDDSADVAISNYCFHHLADPDKQVALEEVRRVLRPGGRLVIGDMMFSATRMDPRSRAVVASKVRALASKGPGGIWRLAKNGARLATGRWEKPATPDWWHQALVNAGFDQVEVEVLEHEGGIVCGLRS